MHTVPTDNNWAKQGNNKDLHTSATSKTTSQGWKLCTIKDNGKIFHDFKTDDISLSRIYVLWFMDTYKMDNNFCFTQSSLVYVFEYQSFNNRKETEINAVQLTIKKQFLHTVNIC